MELRWPCGKDGGLFCNGRRGRCNREDQVAGLRCHFLVDWEEEWTRRSGPDFLMEKERLVLTRIWTCKTHGASYGVNLGGAMGFPRVAEVEKGNVDWLNMRKRVARSLAKRCIEPKKAQAW